VFSLGAKRASAALRLPFPEGIMNRVRGPVKFFIS
jgi:hypothetical protein